MPQRAMSKCALRVAEHRRAVCRVDDASGVSALDTLGDRHEARELLVEEVGAGLVRGREVGHEPGKLEVLVAIRHLHERQRLVGVRVPRRPMPVSSFTCSRAGFLVAECALPAASLTNDSLHATTSASASSARSSSSGVNAPITRILSRIPARRSSRCLLGRRDREPGRAARQRRTRAARSAVSVAICLDHRAELGRFAQPALQLRAVALDRGQVDAGQRPLAHSGSRVLRRPAERRGQRADHVACDHRVGAELRGRDPTGLRVSVNAGARRLERAESLGQEGADHAREHVARAGGRETRAAAGADPDPAAGLDHERVVALEDDRRLRARSSVAGVLEPARRDLARFLLQQAPELSRVGSQDGRRLSAPATSVELSSERVEPVGVDEQRAIERLDERARELERSLRAAEPRTEHDRVGPLRRRRAPDRRRRPRRSPFRSASGIVITSVSFCSKTTLSDAGTAARTQPAPARIAASQVRQTAPVRPVEPPTTSTEPELNLVESPATAAARSPARRDGSAPLSPRPRVEAARRGCRCRRPRPGRRTTWPDGSRAPASPHGT